MSKQQRNSITLLQKVQLIKLREKEKITQRNLAERFGIGKTQVSFILSQKDKLLADYHSGCPSKRRTKLSPEKIELDNLCIEWIEEMRRQNKTFTGPLLRQKAREIARKLNISNFCGSEGWLHRFRNRHDLSLKSESKQCENSAKQECLKDDTEEEETDNLEDYKPQLSDVLSGYSKDAVAHDDNSFFFKVPNNNPTLNAEKRHNPSEDAWQHVSKEICTTTDALKYIHNLKLFLKHDYAALHLVQNLESVLQHKITTEK